MSEKSVTTRVKGTNWCLLPYEDGVKVFYPNCKNCSDKFYEYLVQEEKMDLLKELALELNKNVVVSAKNDFWHLSTAGELAIRSSLLQVSFSVYKAMITVTDLRVEWTSPFTEKICCLRDKKPKVFYRELGKLAFADQFSFLPRPPGLWAFADLPTAQWLYTHNFPIDWNAYLNSALEKQDLLTLDWIFAMGTKEGCDFTEDLLYEKQLLRRQEVAQEYRRWVEEHCK